MTDEVPSRLTVLSVADGPADQDTEDCEPRDQEGQATAVHLGQFRSIEFTHFRHWNSPFIEKASRTGKATDHGGGRPRRQQLRTLAGRPQAAGGHTDSAAHRLVPDHTEGYLGSNTK